MEKENIVLFLGGAAQEGVTARLKAANRTYKTKILESSLKNWRSILDLFDSDNIELVVCKLTNTSFELFTDENYDEVVKKLLERISKIPNMFLSHESLLTGIRTRHPDFIEPKFGSEGEVIVDQEIADYENYNLNDYCSSIFEPPEESIREAVLDKFSSYDITITPYNYNSELTMLASSFIEQNEKNLIFRMYMPTGKIWASEAEKLLHLFRDYLQNISGFEVRQDQYKTNQGVVYKLFSESDISSKDATKEFDDFSKFMDLCVTDIDSAELLLSSKNFNKKEVFEIVEKYSREARRLHIDIKHEREKKILSIRQRLESDLSEFARNKSDWSVIEQVVDSQIPRISGVSSSITTTLPTASFSNITLNINPKIIETVNGVIADEIKGDQNLGVNEKQLIELINSYIPERSVELTSAVHEMVDKGISKSEKISATQKVKGFALAAKGAVGEVATGLVQSIIESQIGI